MGDLNSDPVDGESLKDGIRGLLAVSSINAAVVPASDGSAEASRVQGGVNLAQQGNARTDTADFNDRFAGNLRADYLLPSRTLQVCAAGVFWPLQDDATAALAWGQPPPSSDHRLVWLDISAGAARCPPGSDPTASGPSRPGR
jgi:3-phytase